MDTHDYVGRCVIHGRKGWIHRERERKWTVKVTEPLKCSIAPQQKINKRVKY